MAKTMFNSTIYWSLTFTVFPITNISFNAFTEVTPRYVGTGRSKVTIVKTIVTFIYIYKKGGRTAPFWLVLLLLTLFMSYKRNFWSGLLAERVTWDVYVLIQFYPWFKFYFLLFLGLVMYDMIMIFKQGKIKFKPRIKLNHNIYI